MNRRALLRQRQQRRINGKFTEKRKKQEQFDEIAHFHFRKLNKLLKTYPLDPTSKDSPSRTIKHGLNSLPDYATANIRHLRNIPLQKFYIQKTFGMFVCYILCPMKLLLKYGPVHNKKLYTIIIGMRPRYEDFSFFQKVNCDKLRTFGDALHTIDLLYSSHFDEKLKMLEQYELTIHFKLTKKKDRVKLVTFEDVLHRIDLMCNSVR